MTHLPSENPLILGSCNCDSVSPKRRRDASVRGLGVSDEAIRDIKRLADEDAVTYVRVKLADSDKEVRVEGRNTLTIMILLRTTCMRSAVIRVIAIVTG